MGMPKGEQARYLLRVSTQDGEPGRADGHGNSVPRFHLTWGTGPEVVRIFEEPVRKAAAKGLVQFLFRHRVDDLIIDEKTGAVRVETASVDA